MIPFSNTNQKRARRTILISVDFRAKNFIRDFLKSHFIMIKGFINQEDITILNINTLKIFLWLYAELTPSQFRSFVLALSMNMPYYVFNHSFNKCYWGTLYQTSSVLNTHTAFLTNLWGFVGCSYYPHLTMNILDQTHLVQSICWSVRSKFQFFD